MKIKMLKHLRVLIKIKYFLVFKTNKYKTQIKINIKNQHQQAALKSLITKFFLAKISMRDIK